MNPNNNPDRPILLVEDNPMDIDLTLRAFKKEGLTNIEIAIDGEEALSYIPKWEVGDSLPLIVLMDLKLPKVNGLEVTRSFKEHPVFKVIPIVVLTSSSEDKDIKTAYKYGANSYIVKPVNFNKFASVAAEINLYWIGTTVLPR